MHARRWSRLACGSIAKLIAETSDDARVDISIAGLDDRTLATGDDEADPPHRLTDHRIPVKRIRPILILRSFACAAGGAVPESHHCQGGVEQPVGLKQEMDLPLKDRGGVAYSSEIVIPRIGRFRTRVYPVDLLSLVGDVVKQQVDFLIGHIIVCSG